MKKIFRKTKVIATIGPACDDIPTLKAMIAAGMNVARLNMSHGNEASHAATLDRIRQAAAEMETSVAVMLDTRGREIRTGRLHSGEVLLERDHHITLYNDGRIGDEHGVSISPPGYHRHAQRNNRVLIDDGQIELIVTGVEGEAVHCRVECGGILRNSKGVNLLDNRLAVGDITYDNDAELQFAARHEIEYLAASFVRNAGEVHEIRSRLKEQNTDVPIIAKIENREGVENIEEIVAAANGIMVARGDLGVELEIGEGPIIQKRIIRTTVSNGKPAITATQMLDSMERNPRPTRAEVSDVANAIFDGSSAVMLSGETASGSRPVEAVKTMVDLALQAEHNLREFGHLQQIKPNPSNETTEAVAQASITMAHHLNAAVIVALTETGFTSRLISKYRPDCPILAITSSPAVVRRLTLNWGVFGIQYEGDGSDEDKLQFAIRTARELGHVRRGDLLILTAGSSRQAGSTNLIRVLTVE